MKQAIVAGSLAVAALNLLAGAVGAWVWYRRVLRRQASDATP